MRRVILYSLLLITTIQFVLLLSDAGYPVDEHSDMFARVEAKAQEWHDACLYRLHSLDLAPRTEALAAGLLLGDKRFIDPEARNEIRDAGMSHILAVSGLHVGIVWVLIGLTLSLFLPLVMRLGWNELPFYYGLRVVTLLLLWLYVLVVGCPPSALRAGVMITITQISYFVHRDAWGWHNLAIAVIVLLLVSPSLLYDVGFQLSVTSTAGIMAFSPLLSSGHDPYRHRPWRDVVGNWVKRMFVLTFSAQVFAFPLVAYYFHFIPLLGWLQGLFVFPLVSVLIYGFILLMLCPPLVVVGLPLELASDWVYAFASFISRAEAWLAGGRAEWFPSVAEVIVMELMLVVAVSCWRIGHDKEARLNTHI